MKKLYFLALALLVTAFSNAQLINEFEPNPPGADPTDVSVELKGTPSAAFSGWILSVESDPGNPGVVDRATSVSGSFDANGILVVTVPDFENPSFTVILCQDFTGTVGTTDFDTDNDGVADDLSTVTGPLDAIGIPDSMGDEVLLYGTDAGGQDFTFTGSEPERVFRDSMTNDWYAVNLIGDNTTIFDLSATNVNSTGFNSDPSVATNFGSVNEFFTGAICDVSLGTAMIACDSSTIGDDNDGVTISIPYTGSDADITSVTTTSGGTVAGDDPSTTADGTIILLGLSEGDAWDIVLNGGDCDGVNVSGTVDSALCDPAPSTCFDLSGGAELFELVAVATNSDTDVWTESSGTYSMNGFCGGGCAELSDTWLIFGPLDMTGVSDLSLIFDATEGFDGTELDVQYIQVPIQDVQTVRLPGPSAQTITRLLVLIDVDLSAASGTDVFIGSPILGRFGVNGTIS